MKSTPAASSSWTPLPDVADAAANVRHLGFLLVSPFPPGSEPSRLMVALREPPTGEHFDPKLVRYWEIGQDHRGHPQELEADSRTPLTHRFAWGKIELVDRFGEVNEFVTLGGQLQVDRMANDEVVAVFTSSAPILRMGGHSQADDVVALELAAFFARVMVPIDFDRGAEAAVSAADPLSLYAAFVIFERERYTGHLLLRNEHPHESEILWEEAERVRTSHPDAWEAGRQLLEQLGLHG